MHDSFEGLNAADTTCVVNEKHSITRRGSSLMFNPLLSKINGLPSLLRGVDTSYRRLLQIGDLAYATTVRHPDPAINY